MEATTLRLLPLRAAPGAENMAADDVLLDAAAEGRPALRFYTWSAPTLSLGYFQPAALRTTHEKTYGLGWVRRPSGGAAILHHHELTYCLALPSGPRWQTKESWICRFHHLVQTALAGYGVTARAVLCGQEKKLGNFLCFQHQTPGDLVIESSKIAGSAQRKRRGALMQHGSILLRQSSSTPELPGIAELSGKAIDEAELADRLTTAAQRDLGLSAVREEFTDAELARIAEVADQAYRSPKWNEKR